MNGSAELLQLAHLLRIGADAAQDIAGIRHTNAVAIERLANQALAMADELERIAASVRSKPDADPVEPC